MGDASLTLRVARAFMQTYADGDPDAFVACLAPGWVMHEGDGTTSTPADLTEITRVHAEAFPQKEIEYIHELCEGDRVAHFVRFSLVHSGPYFGLEPTGRRVDLYEMIFHRFDGDRIAESWRMTYPDSVRQALAGDPSR